MCLGLDENPTDLDSVSFYTEECFRGYFSLAFQKTTTTTKHLVKILIYNYLFHIWGLSYEWEQELHIKKMRKFIIIDRIIKNNR